MQDLASVVLHLCALTDGALPQYHGAQVHGLWFDHLNCLAPHLSHALHIEGSQPKPYTLSLLVDLPATGKGIIPIKRGQACRLRITTLNVEFTQLLLEPQKGWLAALPDVVRIGSLGWQVTQKESQPGAHPWVRLENYGHLWDVAIQKKPPPEGWTLQFITPMTLNGQHFCFPFPLPDSLISSWLQRWNQFAPVEINPDLVPLARERLSIERYHLKTVRFSSRGVPLPACQGTITYRAHRFEDEARAALDLLCAYSFFCGSGYKTTQGLGQTLVLDDRLDEKTIGGARGG